MPLHIDLDAVVNGCSPEPPLRALAGQGHLIGALAGELLTKLDALEELVGHPLAEALRPSVKQLLDIRHDIASLARWAEDEHETQISSLGFQLNEQQAGLAAMRPLIRDAITETAARFDRAHKPLPVWVFRLNELVPE